MTRNWTSLLLKRRLSESVMNENCALAELGEGNEFVGFYVLRRCELKESDGLFRLEIELSDRTGTLPGVIWEDAREIREQLQKGDVIKVKGRLGSYRDRPQARIDKIRLAQKGEYDPETFIPSTPKDINALTARVQSLVENIQDPHHYARY